MTIAVVDYGIGNVQSVINACARLGEQVERVSDGDALAKLSPGKIILPGVGAVGAALERMKVRGFYTPLHQLVKTRGVPFLGICVGMQILADVCEEFGTHRALGWIPGRVERLGRDMPELRVPHVGWNTVKCTIPDDPVLSHVDGLDFYFVHSYAMRCDAEYIAATTPYGSDFVSAVRCGNILGVQFHPEKSSQAGSMLIERFIEASG